ncbi:hypothetical protein FEG98_24180 [Escherichia coli]|uniref:hypothetical protein n=1 Tax=Escherichia coli TaxID=562 RepID=UPI0002510FE8|nr:hypothetical protein [Escherichia coli]EHX29827.1 hypothetical protein ECDEC12C_3668 [Escherichia coli DEC12C]EEZ5350205.1 hypothetical protein [Escherichia coli]EFB3389804.1 hypothetical protein [Escherichia coli]EFB5118911.1 hypothetical protein [Escherichia coli]EFD0435195.1 hypothetical protein [Escherichia coli]
MGKKKRNNLKRIEQGNTFNNARKARKQVHKNNEEAGEELCFIFENISDPLTEEEAAVIASMGDMVFHKPRIKKDYYYDNGTLRKWQLLGFTSYHHYIGFNRFNNQVGGATECDLMEHLIETLASNKRS